MTDETTTPSPPVTDPPATGITTGMNFMALDLEMNQPSNRIIQVGVAVGNGQNGVLVSRSWFVDPEEPVDERITDLTGISDETIAAHAVPWPVVASELAALCDEYKPFYQPVQWGMGDGDLLRKEFLLRGIEWRRWGRRDLDVKQLYTYLRFADGLSAKGGLAHSMGKFGLPFEGTPHRADTDARNTLRFFLFLLARQTRLERVYSAVGHYSESLDRA